MSSQLFKIIVLAISIACFLPFISKGQVIYEGQIVDKNTELAVPGVTVRLLKEKTGVITNDQGYFVLTSNNTVPNDTLVFSSVGYHTFQLPVSAYKDNLFLLLHPSNTELDEVSITNRKLKDIRLNRFDWADIATDREITTFSTNYAFAKLFTAPNGNMVLKNIALGRKRREHKPLKTNVNVRFLLRVLRVDQQTGTPGSVLFTKTVSLHDDAKLIRIDLSDDKVVIRDSQFYISVEWLRIPYNEKIGLSQSPKVRKVTKKGGNILENVSDYRISYLPVLLAMYKKKTAVSWVKIDKDRWKPYNSATKSSGLEIALSATVHH